jgi:hypothetical protein
MHSKVADILKEAEFKEGGFVFKHITEGKSNPLIAVQSAVDRMRELHDIEDHEFNIICKDVLELLRNK